MCVSQALVILPNEETAEEMVKVHTFIPVKFNEAELKMSCMRCPVDISTPVSHLFPSSLLILLTPTNCIIYTQNLYTHVCVCVFLTCILICSSGSVGGTLQHLYQTS